MFQTELYNFENINLPLGHVQCFELSWRSKTHRVLLGIVTVQWDLPLVIQVQHLERWIVSTHLSVKVLVTLTAQQRLEYYCKTLFEAPCITSGIHVQPQLYQVNSMGFAGYVAVCVQLYCRCFTVLHLVPLFTLNVSAYMAIFKCVGFFYFDIHEGICFAGFTCTWLRFAGFHLWGGHKAQKRHVYIYVCVCVCVCVCACVLRWMAGPNRTLVIQFPEWLYAEFFTALQTQFPFGLLPQV
jgi:hypothetical protein